MAILGNTLKDKREALGLSIKEVSDVLEIQERFIKALEEENLEIIPNEYYIKAFMKQYGDFLKINGEKLLANFYKEQENLAKEKEKAEQLAQKQSEDSISIQQSLTEIELDDNQPDQLSPDSLERLRLEQESENLSNIDKPTELNLNLSDYEYGEDLKVVPQKHKKNKGFLIWPVIILLGIGVAYLVHAMINLGNTQNVAVIETTTTRASETLTTTAETSTTTTVTETTTETSMATTVSETTTPETTQVTTVKETAVQSVVTQPEYPSGNQLIYVKSSQERATTYGLGSDYKNYTGNYNFTVTVSEPTWISITIHHKVVYEGTIRSKLDFYAYNNADNVIIKTGVSNATKITMNNTPLNIPATNHRVHTVAIELKR